MTIRVDGIGVSTGARAGAAGFARRLLGGSLLLLAVVSGVGDNPAIIVALGQGSGRAWFVAPQGRANNDGSIDRPLDLATAVSAQSPARPGDTIWLRGGVYAGAFTSALTGTASAPIVVRQYPGERATLDGRGAPANTLTINGAHTWFWGFEVMNSDPTRVYSRAVNLDANGPDGVRAVGVNIFGTGIKCINLVVHDMLGGFGAWESAIDTEIYGALVYHNGVVDTVRGHGHGLYIQSRQGTKRIEDVIAFGNHATGMKAYGEAGWADGVHFEGVVSFNNGVPWLGATPFEKVENLFVGTTDNPADRISVVNSMFYHLPEVLGPNVTLGYQNPNNRALVVQNNLIMGGSVALSVRHWQQTAVSGNTLFATTSTNRNADQSLAKVLQPAGGTSQWGNNTYIDGTLQRYPFTFNQAVNRYGGGNLTFDDWRQGSGLDATSSYRAGLPTGTVVRLRPNRYEAGRAHLIVYNWDRLTAVPVDLGPAGLAPGEPFEIRDSQNYFGAPVLQGTYTGAAVSVPLTFTAIAEPIGNTLLHPVHTAPEFFAFVVMKGSTPSAPQPPATPTEPIEAVAAPAISPAGGTFSGAVSVTLSTGTPGATIRYTTDGSAPTSASPVFTSSPLTIGSSVVVQAQAFKSGMTDSDVAQAAFTMTQQAPPTPPPAAGDTTPPTARITSPGAGQTVRRTVLVKATASDNVRVVGVQFMVGGQPIGAEDTVAPFEVSWDTLPVEGGGYYLSAVARDAAGNRTTSRTSFVRVRNR